MNKNITPTWNSWAGEKFELLDCIFPPLQKCRVGSWRATRGLLFPYPLSFSPFALWGNLVSQGKLCLRLGFQKQPKGKMLVKSSPSLPVLRHYWWLTDADTGNYWKRGLDQKDGGAVGAQRLRELHGAVWSWEQDSEARHDVETSLDGRTEWFKGLSM